MEDTNKTFKEKIETKLILKECVKKFDIEIQEIFHYSYGENFETIPEELLQNIELIEKFLEQLLTIHNPKHQKIILMRFGFVTGSPMTVQEVADKFGIT